MFCSWYCACWIIGVNLSETGLATHNYVYVCLRVCLDWLLNKSAHLSILWRWHMYFSSANSEWEWWATARLQHWPERDQEWRQLKQKVWHGNLLLVSISYLKHIIMWQSRQVAHNVVFEVTSGRSMIHGKGWVCDLIVKLSPAIVHVAIAALNGQMLVLSVQVISGHLL